MDFHHLGPTVGHTFPKTTRRSLCTYRPLLLPACLALQKLMLCTPMIWDSRIVELDVLVYSPRLQIPLMFAKI